MLRNGMHIMCKKDLYKSTYKDYAFISGKNYQILNIDREFVWLKDEENNSFNFSKEKSNIYYNLDDYFKI